MARSATMAKARKLEAKFWKAKKAGRKMKFSTKRFRYCKLCGRTRGFIRYFDMCRICVREMANEGNLVGFFKSSE